MKICFYPLDIGYKVKAKPAVYLYGKLEDNTKICVAKEYYPYFYAKVNNVDQVRLEKRLKGLALQSGEKTARVIDWLSVKKNLLGKEEWFWQIKVNFPKAVPLVSKELASWGIKCYEKDILFVHQFLRDQNITPFTLVQVEGEFVKDYNFRVPLFKAENIKQDNKETLGKIKLLALDIETYAPNKNVDPQKDPILMVAFYGIDENGKTFRKVLTWKRFQHQLDYLETVSDEADLLNRFRETILDFRPDILTGYFSDGFDLPYLKLRAEKHNVKLDFGEDRSELYSGTKPTLRDGESKIAGILHLDTFKFVRNIFGRNLNTESYSLDAVSEELLGSKKHEVNIGELFLAWDQNTNQLEDFCKYNLHDAHLALQLCQKLMASMLEFVKITGLPLFDLIRMRFSRLVENYIMKRAMEYNVLAPNRPAREEIEQRSEETYEGGFVYEPTPGIYDNLIVFDFRSLYPTIISAHNIGPESLNCQCCGKDKVPGKEEYWFCKEEKSFISEVLEQLILRRVDLKRLIKESKANKKPTTLLQARSYAIKTLANSFYGYLGYFGARWYCLECAKSTTAYARNYIKKTIEEAEKRGFRVVYGDTDSLFVLLGDKVKDEAMQFMNEINFDLPGHMELEFEGHYPKGIFVGIKGGEKGAKKKYALLDNSGYLNITGFETVRRNWSPISKEVQEKVLHLVLEDKVQEAADYVRRIVTELKEGKIDVNKLVIKTQITKDLRSYSSIGPHVAVALRMLEQGVNIVPGTVIKYVIAQGTGLIRERAKLPEEVKSGNYDAEYYLHNQILPAVNSIFTVLGVNEEELYSDSTQTGLGNFF